MSGTFEKSRFILYAIEQCRDGEAPIDEIFEFIKESKQLAPVAESFELTREDLDDIIDGMVACDAAGSHNGHFSPISGVLFAAYRLRGRSRTASQGRSNGQIPKVGSAKFYHKVDEYGSAQYRGVLFADTLAYLLRAVRGQIPKVGAYHKVDEYFRTGSLVFEPEVKIRQQEMKAFHEERGASMGRKVRRFFLGR